MDTKDTTRIVLPNGKDFPMELYKVVVERVKSAIPGLPFGVAFTLEQICGREAWDALPMDEHTRAGQIVSDLTKHGYVELRSVGCKHKYPKLYERR